MNKSVIFFGCLCSVFFVWGLGGCGQDSAKPPTTEEVSQFKGGGKMTPEEAAAAKMPSGPPAPPAQGAK